MRSAVRRCFTTLGCAVVLWGGGIARVSAADGVYGSGSETDVAHAWLALLFRGIKLPPNLADDAPNLDAVAGALHRALGVYSMSILILAGLVLFYNLALMIIETAHYGVPLGRRSAQVWAPLRLVLAIGFLVPVSGGLNAGQYLVTWMAEQGSTIASRAWNTAASEMKGSFSGIAMPQGPDVAGYVAGGLAMEMCRNLYRHAYTDFSASPAIRLIGNIGDIEKAPPSRFAGETWQYTNRLTMTMPLCGGWNFIASRTPAGDSAGGNTIDHLNNEFADFARTETDKLITEAQSVAANNAGVFLGETAGPGVHDDAAALISAHKASLNVRLHALVADDSGLIDRTFASSAEAGWITAGGFLLELARLQGIYSTIAAHALPAPVVPVLAQDEFLHPRLADMIAADPDLRALTAADTTPILAFYAQVARTTRLARAWLYDRQLADMPLMLSDPFDLRDEMALTNGPEAASSLFSHVLNDAAIANGVWNAKIASPSLLNAAKPFLAMPSAIQNPITALAEFGQRQVALGTYLFGVAGPDMAAPGTLAHLLLLGATGICFMVSGFALMFLVPLLPFIRFFIGIMAWLLSVFEAVIAVPVVALAHINFTGEGLSGGAGRRAYLLWLNIVIRPALVLFGLIIGLLLFTFAMMFLDLIFHQLMRLTAPGGGEGFVAINLGLTFLYTILAVAAANVSFRGINLLPDMAIKWLGGFIPAVDRSEAPVAVAHASAAAGAQGLPGLSPSALLARRERDRLKGPAGIVAAARSYGMALFPQYRGGEKSIGEAPKSASVEKSGGTAPASESFRVMPVNVIKHAEPLHRTLDKQRKGNTDNFSNEQKPQNPDDAPPSDATPS